MAFDIWFTRNIIFQRILPILVFYVVGFLWYGLKISHTIKEYWSFMSLVSLYGMASKLAIPYRNMLLRCYGSLGTSFFNVYFNTGLLCRWFPIWYGLKISHTIQEYVTQMLRFARNIIFQRILQYWSFMSLVSYMVWPQNQPYHIGICYLDVTVRSEHHFSTYTSILVFYVVGFLYGMASKLAIPYRNMLLRCYGSLGTSFFNVYFNTGLLCRWFPIWYGLKISHTIQEYVTQMLRFARNIVFQRILQYWSFMSLVSYMVWPQNQPYHIGICYLDVTVRSEHHFSTYTSILVFYVVGFLYGMASKLAIPYRNMLLRCYGSLGTSFFNVYFNTGLLCRWFPIWYGLKISHTIQEYVTQMLRFARNIIFQRILQYWSFMSLVSYMVWPQNQPYPQMLWFARNIIFTYTSILVFYVVGFLYGMASKLAIPYRNMLLRSYGSLGTSFFNVYFNTGLLCRWFPIWYGLKISHTIQEYVTQMLWFARNIIFQRILQYWSFMSLVSYMVWPYQNQPYHIGICLKIQPYLDVLDVTVRSEHHFSTYTSILVFYVVGFLYGMASKLAIPYRNMLLRCYGSLGTSFFNVYSNTGLLCRWFPIWYGLKISHTIQEYVTQMLRFARNIIFQRILQYWSFMSLVSYMVWPQNQPYHIGICYLDVTVRSEHHFSTYTSILVFYVVGFLYGMASKLAIPYRNMLLRCYGSLGTSFFNVYFNTGLLCRWFPIWYGHTKGKILLRSYQPYHIGICDLDPYRKILRFARNIIFQRILQYWSFMSLVSYMVWPQNQPYHIGICYLDVTVRSEHHFSTYTSILVFYVVGFLYGMASKLAIPYRNMLLRCYGSLGTSFFNVYFNTGLLCRWFPIWYGLKISHTIQEYVTQMLRFARNIIFQRILQYWSFMSLVSYMVWPQNQPYHIGICYLDVMVRSEHHFSTYTSILVFYVVGFLYGMASKLAIPYRNMLLRSYGSLGTISFWFPTPYFLILVFWSFMSLVSYMVWPQNQPYHIGICYLDVTVRSEHHFSTYTSILVFYVVGFLYGMASKLAIPYRNMLLRCYGSLGTSFFNVYFNTGLLCRWFPIWYGLKISHTIQVF